MNLGEYRDVVFLDKYKLEWNLMFASDIRELTFQGVPIVRYGNNMGSPSNFVYRKPRTFYMPPMHTPSIHTLRPIASAE